LIEAREEVLRVPTEAIVEGNKLYVFDAASSTLTLREFEPGIANWEFTEIAAGIAAGEVVVLSAGRQGVEDGAVVMSDDESR
jgi:HlyD family secretion protein